MKIGRLPHISTPTPSPVASKLPSQAVESASDSCQLSDPRWNLIQKMLGSMPEAVRHEVQEALLSFNQEALEGLHTQGVRFSMGNPSQYIGGNYNPWTRHIKLSEPTNSEGWKHLRSYVLHESVHALDHRDGRRQMGPLKRLLTPAWDEFASGHDPKLGQMYSGYVKRSMVDLSYQISQRSQPSKEIDFHCRTYRVKIEGNSPQRLLMEESEPLETLLSAAGPSLTPAVIGAGLGLGLTAAGLPLVGLPLLALGLPHLYSCAKGIQRDTQLGSFSEGPLVSQRSGWQMDLPQEAPKPSMITSYATLTRKPHEYLAEAMADFLHSPELRQKLLERDPEMYQYCLAKGWHQGATT